MTSFLFCPWLKLQKKSFVWNTLQSVAMEMIQYGAQTILKTWMMLFLFWANSKFFSKWLLERNKNNFIILGLKKNNNSIFTPKKKMI